MRVFAAVRPPEPVLDHLAQALAAVGAGAVGGGPGPVRWTAPENRHLTLAFFGEVPDGAVGELEAGLHAAVGQTAPFRLRLRGAGVFAHRTLWVGAAGDLEAMATLTAQTNALGRELTGRSDDRVRSRPHLTIGRARPSRSARPGRSGGRARPPTEEPVAALVRALAVYEGPAWEVTEVRLVQSRPGHGRGGGPLYTDLAVCELTGT